jgi:alkyldihydroxyacetonephosphate synthase
LTGAAPDGKVLLVLGFESADHDVRTWMSRAIELCQDHGGEAGDRRPAASPAKAPPASEASAGASTSASAAASSAAAGSGAPSTSASARGPSETAWRDAFLEAPYLRDTLVAAGVFVETFETAITWDRFDELVATVRERTGEALGRNGTVSCRLTHVYPDGAAPYFTVLAPARRGDELSQWDEVKAAVSEVIVDGGGTITHHHAVGRDHRPWYDLQRPGPFAAALCAAKAAVDPAGMLNPGVLLDP